MISEGSEEGQELLNKIILDYKIDNDDIIIYWSYTDETLIG